MDTGKKFLSGIIIGVAVGAAIILISKTDKGQELWSDLEDAAGDLKDKAKDKYGDAKDSFKDKYGDAKDTFKDKYSLLGKELKSLIKKGKSFIEDLEDKAKSLAD